MLKIQSAIAVAVLAITSTAAISAQPYPPKDKIADSIIVKMKDMTAHKRGLSAVQDRLSTTAAQKVLGKALRVTEQLNRNFWVVNISDNPTDAEIIAIIAELKKGDYGVLTAEPNYYVYPMATVYNDTAWDSIQKPRLNQGVAVGFDNGIAKFIETQRTAGSNKIISIVDTGKLPHVEVTSTIANEVNFAPNATALNKGDSTAGLGTGCDLENDEDIHHGLNMASLAVGLRNNNTGLVGYSGAQSYSVRSLSECDGSGTSVEVIRGILWSAGLDMDSGEMFVANGYPRNDTPATVINLSLGSTPLPNEDLCPTGGALHTAVQRAIAAGSVIVASAGNEYNFEYVGGTFDGQRVGQKLSNNASCEGVVSVGAVDFNGNHARYSNIPGEGERLVTSVPVGSGIGVSDSTFQATINDGYNFGVGTSQATAIMSGLLASLLDVIGDNRPSNAVLLDTIASTGSSFPESDSVCAPTIRDCGTRLNMVALTQALNENVDLNTLFTKIFDAATFNLTDVGTVVRFEDAEGSTEGISAASTGNGASIELKFERTGTFFLKVGSANFAQTGNPAQVALAEVVVSEFGDVAATLFPTTVSEPEANEVVSDAAEILEVLEFELLSGNYEEFPNELPYEVINGKLVFNFNTGTNAQFRLLISYNDGSSPSEVRAQAVRQQAVVMTVQNGQTTQFQPQSTGGGGTGTGGGGAVMSPSQSGGGGGGGSLSLFGLIALALMMIIQKSGLRTSGLKNS